MMNVYARSAIAIIVSALSFNCTHVNTREPNETREPANARFADLNAMRANNCAVTPPPNLQSTPALQLLEVNFNRAREADYVNEPAPVTSLNSKALATALLKIDEDLKDYIRSSAPEWAAIYTQADTCGLDAAERLALLYYGQGPYNLLNKALRNNSPDVERFAAFIAVLDRALQKLRPFSGIVHRGVRLTEAQIAEYQPGRAFTWPAYSSTSLTEPFPGRAQFVIQTYSGRFISPLSSTPIESEILLPRGIRIKVLKHVMRADGSHKIWVQEVASETSTAPAGQGSGAGDRAPPP